MNFTIPSKAKDVLHKFSPVKNHHNSFIQKKSPRVKLAHKQWSLIMKQLQVKLAWKI